MGNIADYYDDRDGSKEELYDLLFRNKRYTQHKTEQHTNHLIYQNKLMNDGLDYEQRKNLAYDVYNTNIKKKVKDNCTCPSCGVSFVKSSYQQKFCKSKVKGKSSCKDFFHNFVNVQRMERLNRK